MDKNLSKGNILIYTDIDGKNQVDVIMHGDTLWLSQYQLEELFKTNRTSIVKHIRNIIKDGELEEDATCAKIAQVQKEGRRTVKRNITYYNLDMVLAVGYRVTSKIATHFRKWSTNVLRQYITQGYALNELRLNKQKEKFDLLKSAIAIVERGISNQIENIEQAKEITSILNDFACGLSLLDDYDHKRLDDKGITTRKAKRITSDELLKAIEDMKSKYSSDLFAIQKDDSFESSINQIYQSFGEKDCYPTLEEKAAMLLYLVVKNHSFVDGNKRIGASCFIYFLDKNKILYDEDGKPKIDNGTLFAITLLIAESKPQEMETVKQVVISLLNRVAPPTL